MINMIFAAKMFWQMVDWYVQAKLWRGHRKYTLSQFLAHEQTKDFKWRLEPQRCCND